MGSSVLIPRRLLPVRNIRLLLPSETPAPSCSCIAPAIPAAPGLEAAIVRVLLGPPSVKIIPVPAASLRSFGNLVSELTVRYVASSGGNGTGRGLD